MTDIPATPPERNPWARRSIIILVVLAVLFVAGDVGNNLRTKSAATKAADATSSWTPSSKKFCAGLTALSIAGMTTESSQSWSARVLSSIETISINAPTSPLHQQFSLLAQDYASLLDDPSGLSTVNAQSAGKFAPTLKKSSDPKVAAYYKISGALDKSPFVKSLAKAVAKCAPGGASAIVTGDTRKADQTTAVAVVDDAYYNDVAANGAFPITSAAVSADIPSGTTATVISGYIAGTPDFEFIFANGPLVCVSSPQSINASPPSLLTCS